MPEVVDIRDKQKIYEWLLNHGNSCASTLSHRLRRSLKSVILPALVELEKAGYVSPAGSSPPESMKGEGFWRAHSPLQVRRAAKRRVAAR